MANDLVTAGFNLIAAYVEAHPELGLKDALRAATVLGGGVDVRHADDNAGRLRLTDSEGSELLVLDLSSWIPTREP